jgi:zinc transport system substrate-binding protein
MRIIVMTPRLLVVPALAIAIATVSACGSDEGRGADAGDRLAVSAAFYPLQYAVSRIGGDTVTVSSLTKPGAEPHDVELTPKQVAEVAGADLVVYEKGFQPAVDEAVEDQAGDSAFDVSGAARLDLEASEAGHEGESEGEHAGHAAVDPHFWLDPQRYADVGDAIAGRLAERDPDHAAAYRANAEAFRADLTALDGEFRTGLKSCRIKDLVTSHAAFGYLARAYGLHQEGITGLDPEGEPNPAELADVAAHIRESGARTVYAETLVSEDVARTLARETGAELAVLDPVEGITAASAGRDYLTVMRANLATLRTGQECS